MHINLLPNPPFQGERIGLSFLGLLESYRSKAQAFQKGGDGGKLTCSSKKKISLIIYKENDDTGSCSSKEIALIIYMENDNTGSLGH